MSKDHVSEDDPGKVDLLLLKGMMEDQEGLLSGVAKSTRNLESHVGEINIHLKNLMENDGQKQNRLNDHAVRLRTVELTQAGCQANTKLSVQGREFKDFGRWRIKVNSFMDVFKTQGHVDTGLIDVHAQQMQHAAEMAVRQSIPFKDAAVRMLPWFVAVFALGLVLATILTVQTLTGNQLIPLPSIEKVEKK